MFSFIWFQANTVLSSIVFNVTDPDIGDNVSYSLSAADNFDGKLPLSIEHTTGQVILNRDYNVDDNTDPELILVYVNAHDSNNSADSALLVISVNDVNDNSPSFPSDFYSLYVPKNLPVGTNVLNLTANDNDLGTGRVNLFRGSNKYFEVNRNGFVYLTNALDTTETQTFAVTAVDGGGRQGNATVTIQISTAGYNFSETTESSTPSSLSLGGSSSTASEKKCCCSSEVQKLHWMIPLPTIFCSIPLAILIVLTRYLLYT